MRDTESAGRALILVVEDDVDIQRLIARRLRDSGIDVIATGTASQGFITYGERIPQLVMIDLGLPDGSGLGLVRQLRAFSDVPIIVVTGNTDERMLVACLEAGADDYITKPFRTNEFIARTRSALRRRPRPASPETLIAGTVQINLPERRVHRRGDELHLTPTEFRLLTQLARAPNRVCTHGMLLTAVWGPEYAGEPHILRVTVNRLRSRLGEPSIIENRPGVGYVLVPDRTDNGVG